MSKIKLVVVNEHTLGYIDPYMNEDGSRFNILHASILKGSTLRDGDLYFLSASDDVRLASAKDFEEYRISFDGYKRDPKYIYAHEDKRLYLLSDGGEVMEARMMTTDEAEKAQRSADEATDGNLNWYGPYLVKDPSTMSIAWSSEHIVIPRSQTVV